MIDVSEKDFLTIKSILEAQVPDCEVRAFGSRVSWTAKDHSDLDLVIVGSGKLENGKIDQVKGAFEDSSLPFRVDVLDWHRISREFQHNIEKNFTVIKKSGQKTSNGWRYVKVADFAEVVGGGTPKTGVPEYWGGEIPWITPKDLSDHNERFIARGERSITKNGLKNSAARLVPENTVLLTSRAPVGYLAIAKKPLTTNQGFRSLIVKEGFSPEFIYYLLLNNVDYLKQHASGSTFQELSGGTLKNLQFQIPALPEQKAIAKILSDLDEKIELNLQMNKTLEAIGQALFKQWFVDEEKNPTIGRLSDILEVIESGIRPKGGIDPNLTEGIPSIGAENIDGIGFYDFSSTKFITPEFFSTMNRGLVKDYDVLVYKDGAYIGRKSMFGKGFPYEKCCVNEHVFILRSNSHSNQFYLYFLLSQEELKQLNTNSAQPGLNQESMRSYRIIIPDKTKVDGFGEVVKPLIDRIFFNSNQARVLSEMRDSLLPKLMSGKIKDRT